MRRLLLTLPLLLAPGALRAQEPVTPIIDSIAVSGSVRNSAQQIISFSGLAVAQPATYRSIQRAIQALFVTGQFDDVRIDQHRTGDKLLLTIAVKERPLLQKWTLKGVPDEDIGSVRRKINLPEGRALDRAALQRSVHAIDSTYRKRGYYAVQIKVTELPQENNQTRVIFDVTPGPRVVVSQVEIEGNAAFKDKDIVKGMATKPEGFWWFRKGEYSEERVEDDIRNAIPNWYADRGHVDLRVVSDTLIADSVPGKAIVRVKLDEGEAYKVGHFEVAGNRRFSSEEISTLFPFGKEVQAGDGKDVNEPFSRSAWSSATDKLSNLYQNNGYITSSVAPEESRRTAADGTHYVD